MYGILSSSTNTGKLDELAIQFVAPLQIINNDPVNSQDTISLKRRVSRQNVQRFELLAGLAPSTGSATMLVMTAEKGHHSPYFIRMPQVALLQYTEAAVTIKGTKNANSSFIDINGASKLVPGEFINIGTDPKVYVVINGGDAGNNVKIFPALRRPVGDGAVIKTGKKVTLRALLNPDIQLGITYVDGILSDPGQYSFVEDLQ